MPDYDRCQGGEELRGQGSTSFNEEVNFSTTATGSAPPEPIVLTSSIRPLTTAAGGLAPVWWLGQTASPGSFAELKSPVYPIDQANRFAISFPFVRDQGDTWLGGGTVLFKVPIVFQDNGSIFGHLPSAGAYSTLYPPVAILEGGYDIRTGRLKSVFSARPGAPSGVPAGERKEDLYPSNNYSFTEIIQNIGSAVADRQTAYMSPSPDISGGADWVWHSSGIDGLEPVFKMIDLNAVDSQSQASFYSGIAFGVAGSAVFALVAEIPDDRKRKSSISGSQNRRNLSG